MSLGKRFLRQPAVQRLLGRFAAAYLRLVQRTNPFVVQAGGVPAGQANAWIDAHTPMIAGMWHGQHIMMPLMRRSHDRVATIISRNTDGNINTIALERLGVRVMRASGARGRNRARAVPKGCGPCCGRSRTVSPWPSARTCRRSRAGATPAS